jgi:glyoxylate/hydroxypyruvate reductase A
MSLLIICNNRKLDRWIDALKACDASLDVQIWPDENSKEAVEFALCWKHPEGILQEYPNLRCVCSMGAGIDFMLNDARFPRHLPVIRLIDPSLAQSMYEYILTAVMHYFREFDIYQAQQKRSNWRVHFNKPMAETTIGVMGLGKLGEYASSRLAAMGFHVTGWARSEKSIKGVRTFAGDVALDDFVSTADMLVCLLPLTGQTRGILNIDLFNKMPKGSCLINVARGQHLIEHDLISALDAGQLRGACLDVFSEEPLPAEHPFWGNEKIIITPHSSSITDPASVAPQIVDNYHRMQKGEPLMNQVDLKRGY